MAGASSSKGQKSGSGPPKKKAKVSEPIDLTEPSSEPESKPRPSQPPVKKSQPSQLPAKESQIPSSMTPKVVIRHLMVTQPPIEGNLDCRARPFHSEICFDTATFQLQPELRDSFHLLQRWTSMTAYGADQGAPIGPEHPDQPEEPVDILADTPPPAPAVASTEHILEVAPSAPQATPQTPPVIPPISEPSPSAELRIAICIIEYRGLCHTFQALATS
ncbi:uncharacterized protein LOC117925978 [Vitis riparia]|uniref:uncharacterized protein LOC117925978 n=1 Tax=Vitis riparia TaxID=96939 RepID=UPI00155B0B7C|nr:uncharacterized protein LOC117925978 [Vitis riparia]